MYQPFQDDLAKKVAYVKDNHVQKPLQDLPSSGRIVLKEGKVVDPKNNVETVKDIAIIGTEIAEVGDDLPAEKGDQVIYCEDLLIVPGLIDAHLHLGDLFEISAAPVFEAAQDGVTMAFSPGAGNTFMAPSLLGAEIDRGLPLNVGLLLGAPSVLGTMLDVDELIRLFQGELDAKTASQKMTRNSLSFLNGPLILGLKDHMGHYLMSDEHIDMVYEITSKAHLMFMSHTQCPDHAERIVNLSKGRPVHLAHATAAGCGTHGDPVESMERVIELCHLKHVSAEFVTSMLRESLGNRDGLRMDRSAQQKAFDALEAGIVKVLNSDGQSAATMKGFGDSRDNVPALLEIADRGVLSLSDAIATMTSNVAELFGQLTKNDWWVEKVGHLAPGALANVTIIDPREKRATYTFVNGSLVSFESRIVRKGNGAGGLVSKFGLLNQVGTGDLATHDVKF